MATSRWEQVRSEYLLGRTRPGSSGRRRAEVIGRRARRLSRTSAGVSETSVREDVTAPLFRRMIDAGEGAKDKLGRMILVPIGFGLVGLAIGPAIAVAAALYGTLWRYSPRIGRLLDWPWLAAGAASAVAGIWVLAALVTEPGMWIEPYPPTVHIYPPVAVPTWLWSQITLGLIFTGLQIRWCGWQAVPRGAVPKPEKDKHGEFIKTPDHKKVRLDPLAGVELEREPEPEPVVVTEEPAPAVQKISLAEFTAESTKSEPSAARERPTFVDEDDDIDDIDIAELEARSKED